MRVHRLFLVGLVACLAADGAWAQSANRGTARGGLETGNSGFGGTTGDASTSSFGRGGINPGGGNMGASGGSGGYTFDSHGLPAGVSGLPPLGAGGSTSGPEGGATR